MKNHIPLICLLYLSICLSQAHFGMPVGKRPTDFLDHSKRILDEGKNPYNLTRDETLKTAYLAQPWEQMRIKYDLSPSFQALNQTTKDWLLNEILLPTQKRMDDILKVKRIQGFLQLGNNTCMEGKDNFTNLFWAETDMVLIVTVENDPTQGYVAYALSCKYDLGSFRPTAGLVNLNLAEMLPVYGSEINPKFNTMQQTTVEHEITHALGFSPDLFEYYQDAQLNTRNLHDIMREKEGEHFYELSTPKIIEKAKEHFGCDDIHGMELEMSGGAASVGAHWEQRRMGNDLMTARVSYHMELSNITLGLLEDTGWYMPDYTQADVLWWGWGQGCDFVNLNKCPTDGGEFCTKNAKFGCDQYGDEKTQCGTFDMFSENCSTLVSTMLGDCVSTGADYSSLPTYDAQIGVAFKEVKSNSSKCFQVKNATAGIPLPGGEPYYPVCYKATCTKSKGNEEKEVLTITIGTINYACQEPGEVIDITAAVPTAYLTCPMRMDVFCGRPVRGIHNYSGSPDDEKSYVWLYIVIALLVVVIIGVVIFCVVRGKGDDGYDVHETQEQEMPDTGHHHEPKPHHEPDPHHQPQSHHDTHHDGYAIDSDRRFM